MGADPASCGTLRDMTIVEMVERTTATGARGIRKRNSRYLAPEQVPRFHCDFCERDISRKIRIKCAECTDFDLCVQCFAAGVESQDHKKTHKYRTIKRTRWNGCIQISSH